MTFWSAGGPNLPALQLFLAKEFLLVRKYNTILSILLIAASAVGIHPVSYTHLTLPTK